MSATMKPSALATSAAAVRSLAPTPPPAPCPRTTAPFGRPLRAALSGWARARPAGVSISRVVKSMHRLPAGGARYCRGPMTSARMLDSEAVLRGARRPLVLGMGGGGDVVGALATAEFSRLYDGTDPVLGGVTWERRAIDPVPGPRSVDEIVGAGSELAPGVLLACPDTRVRD